MKTYFTNGNILYGNGEIPKIEAGDSICYDRLSIDSNSSFQTLSQFKNWLSLHFEFQHLIGEEYPNGCCHYKILSIKNEKSPAFRHQIYNHSIENLFSTILLIVLVVIRPSPISPSARKIKLFSEAFNYKGIT